MNDNKENINVVPTENPQTQSLNNVNSDVNSSVNNIVNNTGDTNQQNVGQIPQGVSTVAPEPQVVTTPSPVLPEQNQTQPQNNKPEKKEGIFKYILAFIFLIAFTGFVIFIPEISKFVKSKMNQNNGEKTTENLIERGTLICQKDKSTDETDFKYLLKYTFDNKKLLTSNYETTIETLDAEFLKQKTEECSFIMEASKEIKGIETTCNNKNGILKINEEYTNQDIDRTNLTAYTEAGGTYPEFEYEQNVYEIQTTLVKQGYDCKVSSIQE